MRKITLPQISKAALWKASTPIPRSVTPNASWSQRKFRRLPFHNFELARHISLFAIVLGVFTLLLIAALAWLCYARPRLQYSAFTLGWWSLRVISALEVIIQGALLVWLSFWLTAYFFNVYVLKLIMIVAVIVAIGVFTALVAIFKRAQVRNQVSGELISAQDAPQLWQRISQLAAKVGTPAPTHVIGGIDDNFFVTQTPVYLREQVVQGRSLFVSLPLLRVMNWDEADAVLAHELAHFSGGDTQFSAAMGAKLNDFQHYADTMGEGPLTMLMSFPLSLFRAACEFGLSQNSRTREFAADAIAAKTTSAQAISRALVKISGYSSYRAQVQESLFSSTSQHEGALNIPERLRAGLSAFTTTAQFNDAMHDGAVPHPFDSHPPMLQRMQNVGAVIAPADFPQVVLAPPQHSWVQLIPQSQDIEQRLWAEFEKSFADDHEQSLAFRYEPANDTERALVLRYFPDVIFPCKKNTQLKITYAGIFAPNGEVLWDAVKSMQYNDGQFFSADNVAISQNEKNRVGLQKTVTLKFAIDSKERERVKEVLAQYWHRHQVMRAQVSAG
jgi:Zn-dependent protease with chaperone function